MGLFVAPDGATLQRAREIVREMSPPRGGATVSILLGDYQMQGTFDLEEDLSGTADCPITYASLGVGCVFSEAGQFRGLGRCQVRES